MDVFKTNLQEFAQKHRKDIRKNPTFRAHFQHMCTKIGVDPLACTYMILDICDSNLVAFFFFFIKANKGFWADLLGVGDFYYELGIQIIEACITSRTSDGGLTELNEVMRRVQTMRGASTKKSQQQSLQQISEDDIVRAIKTMKPLSGGYEVLQIGNRKLVRSVPKELDKDQSALLLLAQV
jgi:ESCRT-II complex subunit VPS22